MQNVFDMAIGAAAVFAAYFLYLVFTKGLPVATTWVKTWWTGTETRLKTLEADVVALKAKVGL